MIGGILHSKNQKSDIRRDYESHILDKSEGIICQ